MNRLLPALCAAIGIAAGLALGYLLAPKAAPQAPAPSIAQERPEAAPTPAAQPAPVSPAQPKADAPDFAALVAKYRPATARTGNGEFSGRVTLRTGQPVEGVEIRCTPYIEPMADGLAVEQEVEAYAKRLALEEAGAKVARTDSDGRYRVTGLDENARYAAVPHKEGHEIELVPRSPAAFHTPGRELHYSAKAVAWVTADVRMPDGSQAELANMTVAEVVQQSRRSWGWSWTPANPVRGFEPGEWRIIPRGGRYGECSGESVSISISLSEPPPKVFIQLKAMPALRGRVKFAPSTPAPVGGGSPFVYVKLEREDGGQVSKPDESGRYDRSNSRSVYQLYPQFMFLDLSPGRHKLTLTVHGKTVATAEVDVTEGIAVCDMEIPEPDPADYIVVRVRGPDGPVSDGVYFMVTSRKEGSRSSGGAGFLNRGNGEYWLSPAQLDQRKGYEHTLTAKSATLGERSTPLNPESKEPIEFSFTEPGFIVVDIAGFEGHPQRGQLVTRHWLVGKEPGREDLMDMFGRDEAEPARSRKIGPLEPGEYVVALVLGGMSAFSRFELDREVVRVSSGEVKVHLVAPPLQTLVVGIPEEYRAGQPIMQLAGDPAYKFIGRSGEAEFTAANLKPGDYHISLSPFGQMTVSVPVAGGRVEFKPLPFNALRLVEFGMGREKKDLGLKAGDIVVQIDGVDLGDRTARSKALAESRRADSTTWVLLRGGLRVSVIFNGKELNQSGLHTEEARSD